MIIDDVEKDPEPVIVRGVDQRLEIVGRAITAFRRERQHAVVTQLRSPGNSAIGINSIAVTPSAASCGNSRATPANPPKNPAWSS